MKSLSTLLFALLACVICNAQNFNGQWKGGFADASSAFTGLTSSNIDYVLELQCTNNEVTGYSYTYFSEAGKQFYTICKIKGTINRKNREVMVTEYERTKTNTPPDFRNCFQTHLLKYNKINSDSEELSGSWIPAPNQLGDCGRGKTFLYRKIYKKILNADKVSSPEKAKNPTAKKILPAKKQPSAITARTGTPNKPTNTTAKKTTSLPSKQIIINNKKSADSIKERALIAPPHIYKEEPMPATGNYLPRVKSLIKTLEVHEEKIVVEFYDNGAVDGDSITVFFNGKIVVSHLGLTEKPATFTLTVDKTLPYNELVMYAENMGTIPPNTALMVVKDGTKQYEVNITSDTERSGTIRFHYSGKP